MKKLVAFVLTASLLISCFSVSAVEVYSIDDDTQPISLPSVLSSSLVSTLEFSSTDSANLRTIKDYVSGSINNNLVSIKSYLSSIDSALGSVNSVNSALYFLSYLPNVSKQLNDMSSLSATWSLRQVLGDKSASGNDGTINGRLYDILRKLTEGVSVSLPTTGLKVDLGFPAGKTLYSPGLQSWDLVNGKWTVVGTTLDTWLSNISKHLMYDTFIYNRPILDFTGEVTPNVYANYTTGITVGLLGLGAILRGPSGNTISGNVLSSSDLAETPFSANNLLSMLSVLLPIQNDLAKITNTIADPTDRALNEANKANKEEVVKDFTGDGNGVSPSDIGSVSDLSGAVSSSFDTSVSAGDFIGQFSSDDRFSLFSQETADDVDTVPSTYANEDEDFIDFYDPENKALWDLIGQGSGD